MKIGILGGTFDPIHFGHLNLAVEILEKRPLDEVWFCPARVSPFKQGEKSVSAQHRLKMLEIALSSFTHFRSIDIELNREGPSYTIDTMRALIEQASSHSSPANFILILGDDAIKDFPKWRLSKEIVRLVPLAIGCRLQSPIDLATGDPELDLALQRGMIPTRIMEISATEVRERLQKGLDCGHLVPQEVLDYIKEFRLY